MRDAIGGLSTWRQQSDPEVRSSTVGDVCTCVRMDSVSYMLESRVPYLTAHQALGHPWPLII